MIITMITIVKIIAIQLTTLKMRAWNSTFNQEKNMARDNYFGIIFFQKRYSIAARLFSYHLPLILYDFIHSSK